MLLLGIESSCDETAAAVLKDGDKLLADVIHSQIAVHAPYGGVVPELASRNHLEMIYPVVEEALKNAGIKLSDLDGIAVTQGPGLVGCLLVGLSFSKALAFAQNIPLIGVDHIAGHLLSVFLGPSKPPFPYIALVVSGGHTSLFRADDPQTFTLLGRTRDDAAGEAFDKVAKLLGLAYPGGPIVGNLAQKGDPQAIPFPRARLSADSLDFSFSGLKTSVANYVHTQKQAGKEFNIPDVCASFQEAVVDVLTEKAFKAATQESIKTIVLAGGVAANQRLREKMLDLGDRHEMAVYLTPPQFCTDNAAMIALAGYHRRQDSQNSILAMDAYSRSSLLETK